MQRNNTTKNDVYREPAKEIPVLGYWDVCVCGGGAAGCAAAFAAAGEGARTLLVENSGYLGGATVSMLVVPVLSTNGVDFQGTWHEWIRQLHKRNGVNLFSRHPAYSYIITAGVDPEQVKLVWDGMLDRAGADVLFHSRVCDVIVENNKTRGVVVETCSGRVAILGKRIIDATGDGNVCAFADVPWEQGDECGNNYAMAMSKIFRMACIAEDDEFGRKIAKRTGERMLMGSRLLEKDPLNPWDLSRAEMEARVDIDRIVSRIKETPGREQSYLLDTSNHVGVRSSRRIHGDNTITASDVWDFVKHPDGIARGSWDIDVWSAESADSPPVPRKEETYESRIKRMRQGEYYDIPYGCLLPMGVENLLMAGRCISAEHRAQASLRIQQTCQATGEAAGLAAAMSIENACSPRSLDVDVLKKRLANLRGRMEINVSDPRSPEQWNQALAETRPCCNTIEEK